MNTPQSAYRAAASAYRARLRTVSRITMSAAAAPSGIYHAEHDAATRAIAALAPVPCPRGFDTPQRMMPSTPPMPWDCYSRAMARRNVIDTKNALQSALAKATDSYTSRCDIEDLARALVVLRERHAVIARATA